MDTNIITYLLFTLPGFCFFWTYKHFTKGKPISDFEYIAWSFIFGSLICISFLYIGPKLGWNFPILPTTNMFAFIGALLGTSWGISIVASFPLGFLVALIARTGLFDWINKKLFQILNIFSKK